MLRKPRGFPLPDPPGPGTKFPPQPFLPKTPFETVTEISPKPLFLLCFRAFSALSSGMPQKHEKTIMQRVLLSEVVFEGAILYKFHFFV